MHYVVKKSRCIGAGLMERTSGAMAFEYLPVDMARKPTRELYRATVRLANLENTVVTRYYDSAEDIEDLRRHGHEVMCVSKYLLNGVK